MSSLDATHKTNIARFIGLPDRIPAQKATQTNIDDDACTSFDRCWCVFFFSGLCSFVSRRSVCTSTRITCCIFESMVGWGVRRRPDTKSTLYVCSGESIRSPNVCACGCLRWPWRWDCSCEAFGRPAIVCSAQKRNKYDQLRSNTHASANRSRNDAT